MKLKKLIPHLIVLLLFVLAAVAYFSPVLQGKTIYQSDIVHYTGMAKKQIDFRENADEELYWTDAAFGGMPTYQLGAKYPFNVIKQIDLGIRFLPRPADYLFLYFIGLYILLLILKLDYKLAFLGALAFGFSTYLIIILGVGHNAKAHAIAYMPIVIAGMIKIFRKDYFWGWLLFTLGLALELNANHFQMTYYLMLLCLVIGIVYLIDFIKKKELKTFFIAFGLLILGSVIAIGTNATNILATKEYAEFSTRGKAELTQNADGSPKTQNGLDYDYITEYSYGIFETFNLMVPRFMGGSSAEKLDSDSHLYKELLKMGATAAQAKDFAENAPTYWGDQTYIGAPAYIGATLIFLFVFALFLVRGKLKWWIVSGSLLALLLSWGDNFAILTKLFLEVMPFYNKFRAVSSIQVLIELCVPVLALVGLSKLYQKDFAQAELINALKKSSFIVGGILVGFYLLKSVFFDFAGANDGYFIQNYGQSFVNALKDDRKAMFNADILRSLLFIVAVAGTIWAFLKQKLNKNVSLVALGILILLDLVMVDRKYVNNEDFVAKRMIEQPFSGTPADVEIQKDTTHFRVLDLNESLLNSARASFFHNSLGGYHAAKPKRLQNIFDYHVAKGNQEVLNMMNVKYFITPMEDNTVVPQKNEEANGNAWFVENVKWVETADEAIRKIGEVNTKKTAVLQNEYRQNLAGVSSESNDSLAQIKLVDYHPEKLVYQYKTSERKLAVFSEVFYKNGWKAEVDGEEIEVLKSNYLLRAAVLPAGNHTVTFIFEPAVIKTGTTLTIISLILFALLIIVGIFYERKRKTSNE